jgi:conjugal transfer/entry exclusion protein
LTSVPSCNLGAAEAERRQAKRNSLTDKLTVEAKVLANLKVEKAAVAASAGRSRPTLGRCGIWETLLGAADEVVLQWLILVVPLLLDPAAVLLLLAATRSRGVLN